jgi:hypothetical protein
VVALHWSQPLYIFSNVVSCIILRKKKHKTPHLLYAAPRLAAPYFIPATTSGPHGTNAKPRAAHHPLPSFRSTHSTAPLPIKSPGHSTTHPSHSPQHPPPLGLGLGVAKIHHFHSAGGEASVASIERLENHGGCRQQQRFGREE